ncbi:MAG: hypothetical protein IKK92_00290 [Prevotella sp.]|nr:hypothetical protein [Prevotella sp.]
MKFKFKIQQYQTDAVERTVEVFEGQPSMGSLTYRRDLGKRAARVSLCSKTILWSTMARRLVGLSMIVAA